MTKIVLIGGPSSGKTTLIKMLGEKGFSIIPEVAADLITARGGINPLDKNDYARLQDDITSEQSKREKEIYKGDLTFLDRGIYDSLAYCEKFVGFVPDLTRKLITEHSGYDRIFSLDRLPFVKDSYRIENDEFEAIELHEKVISVYQNLGYTLERIPVLPREERLNYLLERVK